MRPRDLDAATAIGNRREALVIAGATLLGMLLRLYNLPRLGLVHFDEGIYAIAGLWPFRPAGLAGIDLSVIPYAPIGFPFLVGASNLALGPSDVSAILVSIAAGTLTIPAAAWLARRTYGLGAGGATAWIVALSCFHIAFSRMALTDASFLLAWVVGLGLAGRFLDDPGIISAIGLGVAVGVAQLIKYNGWLLGAAVIAVAIGELVDPRSRSNRLRAGRLWGYGVAAAVVAALIYAPWFRFVAAHGGYGALLAHHRSYIGGPGTWLDHLGIQFEQADALSGGRGWQLAGCLAAVASACFVSPPSSRAEARKALGIGLLVPPAVLLPRFLWAASAVSLPAAWGGRPSSRLLGVAWLILSLLTPFYHPYARLWLPLQLLIWVQVSGLMAAVLSRSRSHAPELAASLSRYSRGMRLDVALHWLLLTVLLAPCLVRGPITAARSAGPGPWESTDSLKRAVRKSLEVIPSGVPGLRVLARPAIIYYLAGKVPVRVEPGLAGLLEADRTGEWALVDAAQLDQEGDRKKAAASLLERWELVREFPSSLSLPALLDRDPLASRRESIESMISVPLRLLRPRSPGSS
ncbi:ArnT family glycosyltransferase [Aquisphaera insulae]|uniref:ArnT family glycosyltransferase n=1 Tax=Aquisphaera insulae TaxID=2712864 RepID=UPI0013EB2E1E|nr:glycosyltransferase family 39 protein [Aquisphaera insulae]